MKHILMALLLLIGMGATISFAEVQATGEGADRDQALQSAMRGAVEQGLGAYIKTSTIVIDATVTDDKILSHSKGYITSYKVIEESKKEDYYSITISATVDDKLLQDDVDALTILRKSVGNPRILVVYSKQGEGAEPLRNKDFIDEIYNGIVESLTDKQFRVVDKSSAEKFAQQVSTTHGIDVDLNQTATFGLRFNAEYTLLYSVNGEIKEGAVGKAVKLRIKTQLIDNTRSQVVTNKVIEQSNSGQLLETILEKAAREGGRKIINPMIEVIEKSWMDMQMNGSLYTIIVNGIDNGEEIAKFTGILEKLPLVTNAREVESGGGKTTFEATYKGKRDQLDRDILRAAKELEWTLKKVRAEGARSTWKRL